VLLGCVPRRRFDATVFLPGCLAATPLILWLLGTLFALVVTCYWIADEIYPYVGAD
jgi:hypothetical protein